ncbi:MAG: general secretion pathway protein GspK [Spirochaetes bacterium]|nr:general secretion pathway protein GspK [Spirochaetota bacterium]
MKRLREIATMFMERQRRRKEALYRDGVFRYVKNSSGYVLAIVLVITSVMMTVAGEFIISARTDIGIMNKYKNRIRAIYTARSGIELSKYVLYIDSKGSSSIAPGLSTDRNVDSYNDLWAFEFPAVPIDDGSMTIKINDEQSKINLSVLANEFVDKTPYYGILQNFFIKLGFPPDYADTIIDWVDIDDSPFPYGAESDYYGRLTPPYAARNTAMESIDDLLLVKGITPEIFYGLGGGTYGMERGLVEHNRGFITIDGGNMKELAKQLKEQKEKLAEDKSNKIGMERSRRLSDYLRVYGERSNYLSEINQININTAPFRVLSALTADMTDDMVAELIMRRIIEPFKSVNEVSDIITDQDIRKNILTVKSSLFGVWSTASYGNATVTIHAIYNRDRKKIVYWSEE